MVLGAAETQVEGKMQVSLVDHMGSDLSVVNAARVSFAKVHDEFQGEKDAKLIRYLAKPYAKNIDNC